MKTFNYTSAEPVLTVDLEHGLSTHNSVVSVYERKESNDDWVYALVTAKVTDTNIKFELAERRYVKINMIATA